MDWKKIALVILILITLVVIIPSRGEYTYKLKPFTTYHQVLEFFRNNMGEIFTPVYKGEIVVDAVEGADFHAKSSDYIDFSKTNVQVEGVDEPDFVKTDGEYIYMVTNQKIYIIRAYPPENANISSKIVLDVEPMDIFINKDYLIVFCYSYRYLEFGNYSRGFPTTLIKIYNISNREEPKLIKDIEVDGRYFDARMLDNYVYIVTIEEPFDIYFTYEEKEILNLPKIRIDNETISTPINCIYYMDMPYTIDSITNVIAISIRGEIIDQKSFVIGNVQTMYVSKYNIFLACRKYSYSYYYKERTIIHRISIKNGKISYEAFGEVLGRILNQFSMDEYNGFFRIATTIGYSWTNSSNNIYILDENLSIVGKLENIAVGEEIYSARFMGNRAYLVTFKRMDPFFVINLSNPYKPEILGKLKIPGYSDYLHPYDENHIIGIGKEADENIGVTEGLKIALFDVTNPDEPKEIDKVVIGDIGTDSLALYDHKAFLFDRKKELLVIPVRVHEMCKEIDANYSRIYRKFVFQGAYVYKLNLSGFKFKGRITHLEEICWDYESFVKRALYIDNVLYTISNKMVKMNDLDTLEEIGRILL